MCNPSKLLCKLKPEFCWSVRACIVHFLLNYFPSWQLFLHLTAVASCSKFESDLFTNAFDLFRTFLYCLSYTLNCFLFIDAFDLFWTSPFLSLLFTLNCLLFCNAFDLFRTPLCCLLFPVYCTLFTGYCFLWTIYHQLSTVFCMLFILYCLLFTAYFLLFIAAYYLFKNSIHTASRALFHPALFWQNPIPMRWLLPFYLLHFAIHYPISTIPKSPWCWPRTNVALGIFDAQLKMQLHFHARRHLLPAVTRLHANAHDASLAPTSSPRSVKHTNTRINVAQIWSYKSMQIHIYVCTNMSVEAYKYTYKYVHKYDQ